MGVKTCYLLREERGLRVFENNALRYIVDLRKEELRSLGRIAR
jgi:hypothetical protein